jgi:tetratricopeptide (TPR) repeat protein
MQPKMPKPNDTFTFYTDSPDFAPDIDIDPTSGQWSKLAAAGNELPETDEAQDVDEFPEISEGQKSSDWKAPFLLLWLIASLPFVSYTMWRAMSDLQDRDWISLAARTRRLHKVGFKTRNTRYWLAIAYSNLNQWAQAVQVFEKMSRPLESVADDAARYCAHVWALKNLGRTEEASELLMHSMNDDWPEERRNWAGRFLEHHSEDGTPEFVFEIQPTLLH